MSKCLDPGSIVEERNVTYTGCDNKSHTTTLFLFVFISVSALKLSKYYLASFIWFEAPCRRNLGGAK